MAYYQVYNRSGGDNSFADIAGGCVHIANQEEEETEVDELSK